MSGTSSRTSSRPFAHYDRGSQSWKTFPATGEEDSEEYSGAWPRWGSMRSGTAYELPRPAHLTEGNGFSSLPTPVTSDANGPGPGRHDLRTAIADAYSQFGGERRLTAAGEETEGRSRPDVGGSDGAQECLVLLPAPNTGQSPNSHGTRGGRPGNGRRSGADLGAVVKTLLPTPTAGDCKGVGKKRTLVEAKVLSIGESTNPPSAVGNT